MPCSVTSTGTPVTSCAYRAQQPSDAGSRPLIGPPRRGRPVGVDAPLGVVVVPLVVLDGDEVVLAGQLEPALVDLGALAVPQARVVAVHLVVDDGEGEADRQLGPPRLDRGPGGAVPGGHPVADRVPSPRAAPRCSSGTAARPPPRSPPPGWRAPGRGRPAAARTRPAWRGRSGSFMRDRVGDPLAERGHHPVAVPGEQGRRLAGRASPPRIANQCGEVKWLNVTTGARPRARQWSAIAA